MKSYPMPDNFSGSKFATRYGLDGLKGDFWAEGGRLFVRDNLPDDPPIFELSDPPGPTKEEVLEQEIVQIKTRLSLLETRALRVP